MYTCTIPQHSPYKGSETSLRSNQDVSLIALVILEIVDDWSHGALVRKAPGEIHRGVGVKLLYAVMTVDVRSQSEEQLHQGQVSLEDGKRWSWWYDGQRWGHKEGASCAESARLTRCSDPLSPREDRGGLILDGPSQPSFWSRRRRLVPPPRLECLGLRDAKQTDTMTVHVLCQPELLPVGRFDRSTARSSDRKWLVLNIWACLEPFDLTEQTCRRRRAQQRRWDTGKKNKKWALSQPTEQLIFYFPKVRRAACNIFFF